ncbi:NucA/NucB deoxyribonuclease domain-containing protein [Parenemella sanctibonifatiensis]|uniref:NucA/NucB deoxyribonuclease domain-containing protein n=1 Tax=Parenemella sanctibonifatiensis TaxID=2016505 RepID=UPI00118699DD|nr:hypothetical protein [Parenemella sanctibonifatiensis]
MTLEEYLAELDSSPRVARRDPPDATKPCGATDPQIGPEGWELGSRTTACVYHKKRVTRPALGGIFEEAAATFLIRIEVTTTSNSPAWSSKIEVYRVNQEGYQADQIRPTSFGCTLAGSPANCETRQIDADHWFSEFSGVVSIGNRAPRRAVSADWSITMRITDWQGPFPDDWDAYEEVPYGTAQARCDHERGVRVRAGCIFPGFIPTVVFSRSSAPEFARHVEGFLAMSNYSELTRATTAEKGKNRNRSCHWTPADRPDGTQCDEFPFASTVEGAANPAGTGVRHTFPWCSMPTLPENDGTGISECFINAQHNAVAGQKLLEGYDANRVLSGDKFRIAFTDGSPEEEDQPTEEEQQQLEDAVEPHELGAPLGPAVCAGGACIMMFAHGMAVLKGGEALVVHGAIYAGYSAYGGLGLPLENEHCDVPGGGCSQTFDEGTVYWSLRSGAHPVFDGQFLDRYDAEGGAHELGLPTSGAECTTSGCNQTFERGVLAQGSSRPHVDLVKGRILDRFRQDGALAGLGYPLGDEFTGTATHVRVQRFSKGNIYWTLKTDAFRVDNAFLSPYGQQSYEGGSLGVPTGSKFCGLRNGGCAQRFEGGMIYSSQATPPRFVRGEILNHYSTLSWETGPLGYPVANESCGLRDGGCVSHFEHGSIYWSPTSGVGSVHGLIQAHWVENGAENGPFGYPQGTEEASPAAAGARISFFENGFITWVPGGPPYGEYR